MSGTIAIYVRIPAELHARLMVKAAEAQTSQWRTRQRGGIQRVVIGALEAALPVAPEPKAKKKGKAK